MSRNGSSACVGQSAGSAGHHSWASCSGLAVTVAPAGSPCLPDEHRDLCRQADQRLDGESLSSHRPLLGELAGERLHGVLVDLDRARSAERPAPGPGRQPARASPGQPAALGVPDDAQRRQRARAAAGQQPQRPAHRLALQAQRSPIDRVVAQPGGEAVVAGRAAIAQLPQRRVGGRDHLRRRRVGLAAPHRPDVLGRPRATREDAGFRDHRHNVPSPGSFAGRRPRTTPASTRAARPAPHSRITGPAISFPSSATTSGEAKPT